MIVINILKPEFIMEVIVALIKVIMIIYSHMDVLILQMVEVLNISVVIMDIIKHFIINLIVLENHIIQ